MGHRWKKQEIIYILKYSLLKYVYLKDLEGTKQTLDVNLQDEVCGDESG